MFIGEDFAQRAVVGVGHAAVGKDKVVFLIFWITGQCLLRPAVLIRRVVEDKVEHQADAFLAQVNGQLAQISHRAQASVHLAIIADGITAVAVAFWRFEERHQVQISQAEFFKVRNLLAQFNQIAGKEVHIADAAQHLFGLKPDRIGLALRIERLKFIGSIQPALCRHRQNALQVVEEVVLLPIERQEQTKQVVKVDI